MLSPVKRLVLTNIYTAGGCITAEALRIRTETSRRAASKALLELEEMGYLAPTSLAPHPAYPKSYAMTQAGCTATGKPRLPATGRVYHFTIISRLIHAHFVMELRREYPMILTENGEKVGWLLENGCPEEAMGAKVIHGERRPWVEVIILPQGDFTQFAFADRPVNTAGALLKTRLRHMRDIPPEFYTGLLVGVDNLDRENEYRREWERLDPEERGEITLEIHRISTRYSL